jgi:uncharacterized membrane protein HdeD (DUF308 family)
MLHKLAIALILVAVACFVLVPVLGAILFVVGIAIETIGYFVWGVDFWLKREARSAAENEPR